MALLGVRFASAKTQIDLVLLGGQLGDTVQRLVPSVQ